MSRESYALHRPIILPFFACGVLQSLEFPIPLHVPEQVTLNGWSAFMPAVAYAKKRTFDKCPEP